MIVEPDFVTHWKTKKLTRILGNYELAPMCVIKMWAHCHRRRTDRFKMSRENFADVCEFNGDADEFYLAMLQAGFIEVDEDGVTIAHDFKETNAYLFASWNNGKLGGRPAKKPSGNPAKPSGNPAEPSGNPAEPSGNPAKPSGNPAEPSGNPAEPSGNLPEPAVNLPKPRREEKRREEKNPPPTPPLGGNGEEDVEQIQFHEAQTDLKRISKNVYNQPIAVWGMEPLHDQLLQRVIPADRQRWGNLIWLYSLPPDHELFQGKVPGHTMRKDTFKNLLMDLEPEMQKAEQCRRRYNNKQEEEIAPPGWRA